MSEPTALRRPLIATGDAELLSDLLRVAAAAGVEPHVVTDITTAWPHWPAAPLIIVGADLGAQLRTASLAARPGVLLVGRDASDIAVWRSGFAIGATGVLCMPADEAELASRIADAAEGPAAAACTVCVVGACGGAGASTFATALAVVASRRGMCTTLIDADPNGGDIDLLVGAEDVGGLRWSALHGTHGRIGAAALRDALPLMHGVRILSCDTGRAIDAAAMTAVLDAVRRASDAVIVDLPRELGSAADEALTRADHVLLVVPARVRAVNAAARIAAKVAERATAARIVVRGPASASLTTEFISRHLDLLHAGEFATERSVADAAERGVPPGRSRRGSLSQLCHRLVDDLINPAAAGGHG